MKAAPKPGRLGAIVGVTVTAALVVAVCAAILSAGARGSDSGKHWGYHDSATTVGPSRWGSLPGNELCATGQMQTPIALRSDDAVPGGREDLSFDYKPTPLKMTNNGHTIQFDYAPGSELRILDAGYRLQQFHFHVGSEHTLDGKRFPLEIHFVHVASDGKPAVVLAVFVEEGTTNPTLARAFTELPQKKGETVAPEHVTINALGLLPADRSYFHYIGSLTTPPCTEGVDWYIFKTPITMDSSQIRALTRIPHMRDTHRPLQKRGSRKVEERQ